MTTFTPIVEQGPLVPQPYVELIDQWSVARDWFQAHSLSGLVGMGIQEGPVAPHVDVQIPSEHYVVGWMIASDGHYLCTKESRALLEPGCLYCLDPAVEHWTESEEHALIKFFFTSMPKSLPFYVKGLVRVFSDDLERQLQKRDNAWITAAPIVPTIPLTSTWQPTTLSNTKSG